MDDKGCVPDWIAGQAARRPDAVALVQAAVSVTYAELNRTSDRLAAGYRSLGVGPGFVVAILLERGPAMVTAALATMKGGGAYLPLDPAQPTDRLEFILNDSNIELLVTTAPHARRIQTCAKVIMSQSPPLDGAGDGARTHCGPDDLAYIIYTSGSTGQPKGVEVPHRGLSNLVLWHNSEFGVQPSDRATQLANIAFDAAVWEVWPYLAAGASVWFVPDETVRAPSALRDFLVSHGISAAYVPTPVAEALLTIPWPRDTALRVLLTGGDVLQRFPPLNLPFLVVNNYGPTECSVVSTSGPVSAGGAYLTRPNIGSPIRNTTCYLLDDRMRPVRRGSAGEIYIGGDPVARGYRNRPDLTALRFVPDPFSRNGRKCLYRTGDLARQLPDGSYEFIGRVDDQISLRGYRIEPNEVSAAINRHPNVQASAVACRTTPAGEKQLVAYVVPANGAPLTHSDLSACAAALLPGHMVPSVFVRLQSLPVSDRGKVLRAVLPPPDGLNTIRDNEYTPAPASELPDQLAGMVAGLLKVPNVSVHDNFFMLGGHSLMGAQLLVLIRESFGVEIALEELYEAPTAAILAQAVQRALSGAPHFS